MSSPNTKRSESRRQRFDALLELPVEKLIELDGMSEGLSAIDALCVRQIIASLAVDDVTQAPRTFSLDQAIGRASTSEPEPDSAADALMLTISRALLERQGMAELSPPPHDDDASAAT